MGDDGITTSTSKEEEKRSKEEQVKLLMKPARKPRRTGRGWGRRVGCMGLQSKGRSSLFPISQTSGSEIDVDF